MPRVIDLECNLPAGEEYPEYHEMQHGPPGNRVADRMERPEGYGFDNYKQIFSNRSEQHKPVAEEKPGDRMKKFIADMDRAGVEIGVLGASNDTLKRLCPAYPDRFVGLAAISPLDGMRGVREFEHLVREHQHRRPARAAALQPRSRQMTGAITRSMRNAWSSMCRCASTPR